MVKAQLLGAAAPLVLMLAATPAAAQTSNAAPQTPSQATDPAATTPNDGSTTAQAAVDPAAQANGAAPQGDEPAGEVVVTGSRIASPAATAASPLQVIGAEQIRQSGTVNVQDVLLQNPVFGTPTFSRTNTAFATQGAGAATVDLRNLGIDRTLVLVNGRRFVAGIPGSSAVDLNVIPTQFIERVDILTGGASAVYGSDAVAGVVNIIYKTKFEGIQLDGQAGVTEEGDGGDQQVNLLVGHNFAGGRGNIMLFGGYSNQGQVLKRDRSTEGGSSANDTTSLGGSITGVPADLFTPYVLRSGYTPGGRFYAGDSTFTYNPNNTLTDCSTTSCGGFNRSDFRYLAVPVQRYTAAGRANFEVSRAFNLFLEGNYAKTKSQTVIEPFPLSSDLVDIPTGGQVPIQTVVGGVTYRNPYVPDAIFNAATDTDGDGLKDIFFDRRLSDFGPRTSSATRDLFRIAGGANGSILGNFTYEVYGIYGQSVEHQTGGGQFDSTKFTQALNAYRDPVTGTIQCADPAARAAGCIPANIYGINALAATASYIAVPTTLRSKITQTVGGGNLSGKLFSVFGADPIGVSIGGEYRRESSTNDFDLLTQLGLNGNNALPSTSGSFDVYEGFAEAIVPLLQDRPFFHSLSIRGAVRASHYSTVGDTFSYNYGGEWSPVQDVRFRVMQARSVRAPNINELYAGPQQDFPSGLQDPCTGVTAAATTAVAVNCRAAAGVNANIAANTGVGINPLTGLAFTNAFTPLQADIQGITSFAGGNPNLQEEKGDSFTAGVVLNPRSIAGLRNLVVTVDYFNIRIKDAIVSTPLQFILNQCYASGQQQYCGLVVRRPAAIGANSAGSLDEVNSGPSNSGGLKTSGIDVAVDWRQRLFGGSLNLHGAYTHLVSGYSVPLPNSPRDVFAGEIGAPRDKFTVTTGYDIGGVGLTLTGTYVGRSYLDDQFILSNFDGAGTRDPAFRVNSQFYLDSQVRFRVSDRFEFYVGGDNLLNNKPPYLADIGADAGEDTLAGTYDPLLRRYYAGFRIRY